MAERDRFTPDEWEALVKAPSAAFGAIVAVDHPGLTTLVKEAVAGGKAIRSARREQGWPPVVAEMITHQRLHQRDLAADTKGGGDMDESLRIALDMLTQAGAAAQKLTPNELDGYVEWVLGIGRATAEAAVERGSTTAISPGEAEVLAQMEQRLRGGGA